LGSSTVAIAKLGRRASIDGSGFVSELRGAPVARETLGRRTSATGDGIVSELRGETAEDGTSDAAEDPMDDFLCDPCALV
jgi:hypothetical protein